MHAEIQRAQLGMVHLLAGQRERLDLLPTRELDDLKHEAAAIRVTAQGTERVAGDMTYCLCEVLLDERSGDGRWKVDGGKR